MHLRFDLREAEGSGYKEHPQKVMRDLGISYQLAIPQSIADQWWFFNCKNLPTELPEFLEVLDINPLDHVGNGLSEKEAKSIVEND